ncbi:MAG TPA: hypothetical protein VGH49_21030 [Xanthobacteraceae bacterium]|jgi:hypothetical protein
MSCLLISSSLLSATSRLARSASREQKPRSRRDEAAGSWWRRLCRPRRLLDPYRPELHYMRGPGPKWREKHLRVPPQPDPASRRAPDHSEQRSI